jgi:hypothetical protein
VPNWKKEVVRLLLCVWNHLGASCIPSAAMRHIEPEVLETV